MVVKGDGVETSGGWSGGFLDQMSFLSLFRFARTHTRHGWRKNTRTISASVAPGGVYGDAHLVFVDRGSALRVWWYCEGLRADARSWMQVLIVNGWMGQGGVPLRGEGGGRREGLRDVPVGEGGCPAATMSCT